MYKNACRYYREVERICGWEGAYNPLIKIVGVCVGVKNSPECYCGGDEKRCSYYLEKGQEEMNS